MPLVTHLEQVVLVAEKVAKELSMDTYIARQGAILHDIGKASPIFQKRLYGKDNSGNFVSEGEYFYGKSSNCK